MKRSGLLGIIVLAFCFVACTPLIEDWGEELGEEACLETYASVVTKVIGDVHQIRKNEELMLTIGIKSDKPCSEVYELGGDVDGNVYYFNPYVGYHTCGACPNSSSELLMRYVFVSNKPGDYSLKFKTGEQSYLTYAVTVMP